MVASDPIQVRFIDGGRGRLFSLHYPARIKAEANCFVVIPSFAEEMNRCRYMCTLLAQSLADLGHGFLSVDPYGTGDSEGDFRDFGWRSWQDDLRTAIDYAQELGYSRISLFAIRGGALQAFELVRSIPGISRVLLWQPIVSGKTALTQFLRIKIASSIERDEKPGTIADFTEQIDSGNNLEVAGYEISPELFKGLGEAELANCLELTEAPISWFTNIASAERKVPRVELNIVEQWRANGAVIDHHTVIGPAYWQAHERTLSPELIEATVRHLKDAP